MLSDGERSDEDSRLEEATNGDAKAESTASTSKMNGNADDGDESSVASTSKEVKSEAKDKEPSIGSGKSKARKKKKGAAYRLRSVSGIMFSWR
jgi:hypothetical protein